MTAVPGLLKETLAGVILSLPRTEAMPTCGTRLFGHEGWRQNVYLPPLPLMSDSAGELTVFSSVFRVKHSQYFPAQISQFCNLWPKFRVNFAPRDQIRIQRVSDHPGVLLPIALGEVIELIPR